MSGLLPTLAIYFQDYDEKHPDAPCRRNVLNVIATMITLKSGRKFQNAEDLFRFAIENTDQPNLEQEVVDCAIALKQVIRTYNLV